MFQRKQPAESTVSFDLPSSVANIDDESDNSPGGHLQKSRNSRLLTEKLFKKKVSSRLLHHDELQQNSQRLRESESSIKLILDQHHPHSKHSVKIFSTGTPIISKRSAYDSDRRKATMKHILQSTGNLFEVRCTEFRNSSHYLHVLLLHIPSWSSSSSPSAFVILCHSCLLFSFFFPS
jgi:hypothetical protein